jgi:hypothetical protein
MANIGWKPIQYGYRAHTHSCTLLSHCPSSCETLDSNENLRLSHLVEYDSQLKAGRKYCIMNYILCNILVACVTVSQGSLLQHPLQIQIRKVSGRFYSCGPILHSGQIDYKILLVSDWLHKAEFNVCGLFTIRMT